MIRCEHPVVLLNPSIKKLTQSYDVIVSPIGTIHLADHHLPKLSLLYPKRCGVTPDTASNYALVNESTGETKPLYIVVPCGRCVLCRKRKSNELAARLYRKNSGRTKRANVNTSPMRGGIRL